MKARSLLRRGVRRWRASNACHFQGCGDFLSRVYVTLTERSKGARL